MWKEITSLSNQAKDEKWNLLGDSNEVFHGHDSLGFKDKLDSGLSKFHHVIDQSALIKMHSRGGTFTWSNGAM